jgi:hypothetical protein
MMEFFGVGGTAVSKSSVVGYASTIGGAVLAVSVNPDTLPILFGAIGIGSGLAWSYVSGNRDRAREALVKQIDMLQKMLDEKDRAWQVAVEFKDSEREKIRTAKLELEKANERLEVRIARLEEERLASGRKESA